MNLWVVFITGLTVGGLTCLAVQGGLLASVIAAAEEKEIDEGVNTKNPVLPTLSFLVSKLIAYTILGFILGAFGGTITISQSTQIMMQFFVGAYMIAVALNLLNVHPMFRYVVIQPPKFLSRKLRNQSKSKAAFAPAILGAMTIFIPCGTTLAMEALAISSANAFSGAAIMAVFVLGTTPLFFGVGWLTSFLGDNFRTRFLKVAAIAVFYLGLTSINGAFTAVGSPLSIPFITVNNLSVVSNLSEGVQNIEINVTGSGYNPRNIRVKKNLPVRINLKSQDAYSCASAFRIPSLGIARNLQPNGTETIEFTPTNEGNILFTCSMGMFTGVIEVI